MTSRWDGARGLRARSAAPRGTSAAVGAASSLVLTGLLRSSWFLAAAVAVSLPTHLALGLPWRRAGRTTSVTVAAAAPVAPSAPDAPTVDVAPGLPGVDPDTHLDIGATMTDLDLCRAWRSSYVALERAGEVISRGRIVAARRVLLDELERRHPDVVRQWLEAGARAAGGPERYLRGNEVV